MNKKNGLKMVLGMCILCFVCFLCFKIAGGLKKLNQSYSMDLPSSHSITSEDSDLIAPIFLPKLEPDEVFRNRNREPISFIFFDKKYYLVINKIGIFNNIPLKTLLKTKFENAHRTTEEVYNVINKNFKLQYRAVSDKPTTNIYLTIAGDSIENTISNDSIVGYHLMCDNFSIRYEAEDAIDIFGVGYEKAFGSTLKISMNLLLLEHSNKVYLLIMTPIENGSSIPSRLLNDIIR